MINIESGKRIEMDNILEKINHAGLRFLEPLNLETTYQTIVKEAVSLVGADNGALHLNDGKKFIRVASYPEDIKKMIEPRKKGFTHKAYKERKAYVVDLNALKKAHPEFKVKTHGSAIYIPISYHRKSIGSLALISFTNKKFSNKDLDLLKIFGSYASLAIRKAQLIDETKRAIEVRDLFISLASHELRTPLTTINGYIQLLKNKIKSERMPETKWVEELSWEAYRLTQLVSELLEINRIKSGQFHYIWKECNIREVIDRALMDFKFNYPNRRVIWKDYSEGKKAVVIGDFDKLLQVIINLLDNAAKFSKNTTEIEISLKVNSQYLAILIKDKGRGISKEDLLKVFEGFYKGAQNNEEQGMGIGLFLAKSVINQHHGNIQIKSKLNKGTMVEVKLPKSKHKIINGEKV